VGPGKAQELAQGSEPTWPVEQWLLRPIGWGLARSASYSFSISWCGESFHELGVQSADVSALPFALLQPSVSPVSQKSPWVMELRRFAAVFQSSSCFCVKCFLLGGVMMAILTGVRWNLVWF
jgi:hypothetical protein